MYIDKTGNWKVYWGIGPLPTGAEAHGVITRQVGESGALIKLRTGIFVQGNAGAIRSLPQTAMEDERKGSRRAPAFYDCECYFECEADSHSGDWHTHEDNPCPVHPDATMVG